MWIQERTREFDRQTVERADKLMDRQTNGQTVLQMNRRAVVWTERQIEFDRKKES